MDWDYIQSVGGIAMGEPYFDGAMLKIPLIHDFSGTQKITVEPTRKKETLRCAAVDKVELRSFPFDPVGTLIGELSL